MIATELSGGGGVHPDTTNAAEAGLYAMLKHVGVLPGEVTACADARLVEWKSGRHSLNAAG